MECPIEVETISERQLRDFAAALSAEQARIVIEAIGIIDMSAVAKMIGVAYHRVKMLRHGAGTVGGGPRPDELPEALPLPGASPMYLRREIMTWARQAGRVDRDGQPVRLRASVVERQRDDAGRFTH